MLINQDCSIMKQQNSLKEKGLQGFLSLRSVQKALKVKGVLHCIYQELTSAKSHSSDGKWRGTGTWLPIQPPNVEKAHPDCSAMLPVPTHLHLRCKGKGSWHLLNI